MKDSQNGFTLIFLLIGILGLSLFVSGAYLYVQKPNKNEINELTSSKKLPEQKVASSSPINATASNKVTKSGVIPSVSGTSAILRYRVGEPALLLKEGMLIPAESKIATFKYKWSEIGKDARLRMYFNNDLLFSSTVDQFAEFKKNDGFAIANVWVSQYSGKSGKLSFELVATGTESSVVNIKELSFISYWNRELPFEKIFFEGKSLSLIKPTKEDYYPGPFGLLYYKGENTVYTFDFDEPTLVVGADPDTFSIDIGTWNPHFLFATDKRGVYYHGEIVFMPKNPKTDFSVLGWEVSDCRGASYVMINNEDGTKTIYAHGYSREVGSKSFVVVEGADPDTFETLYTGYAKDKNYVYNGSKRTSFDPATFDLEKSISFCPLG
jgi:hypothetical protein